MTGFLTCNSLLTFLRRHKRGQKIKHVLFYIVLGVILTFGSSTIYAWPPPPTPPGGGYGGKTTGESPMLLPSNLTIRADGMVRTYQVQVAACTSRYKAMEISSTLNSIPAIKQQIQKPMTFAKESNNGRQWYKIKAGPFSHSKAVATLNQIQSLGYPDAFIITTDISIAKANVLHLPLTKTLYRQALANAERPSGNIYSIYSTGFKKWSTAKEPTDWISAIPHFTQVINSRANAHTKAESHYALGNIYMKLYLNVPKKDMINRTKYCEAAIDVYSDYIRKYPQGPHAAEAQLKIADCEFALSDYHPEGLQKAVVAYRKVSLTFMTQRSALQYANALFVLAENGKETWRNVRSILNDVESKPVYRDRQRRYSSRAKAMLAETYCFSGDMDPSKGDFIKMKSIAEEALKTPPEAYGDIGADVVLNNYLIGRALFEMNNRADCQKALDQFNTLLATYPDTYSPDDPIIVRLSRGGALFAKSICHYRLGGQDSDCQSAVTQLLHDYPDSQEAKIAGTWTNGLPPTTWKKF